MSKIITTNLKHFNRMEEQEILEYVAEHNNIGHVSVFGTSGTGKTELISSSISLLHNGDFFLQQRRDIVINSFLTDSQKKEILY